ncbi:unnamed protein product [Lampetra fluviatilis]
MGPGRTLLLRPLLPLLSQLLQLLRLLQPQPQQGRLQALVHLLLLQQQQQRAILNHSSCIDTAVAVVWAAWKEKEEDVMGRA